MKPYTAYSLFKTAYLHKVGRPYIETKGRDLKLMQLILKDVSPDDFPELVDLYFKQNDTIYSPVFFKTAINDLMQKKTKADRNKRHTFKNSEALRWI